MNFVLVWILSWLVLWTGQSSEPQTFRIATFNLENYLIEPSGTRSVKPLAAREQVVRDLTLLRPDVVAVQEMGPPAALEELQQRLRAAGVNLPHLEHVRGWDTNIFVAVLSRFPFTARRSHSNDAFLLAGRRFHMSRGIVEVEIEANARTRFTLLAAHLKSKRQTGSADEADLREAEAKVLRSHIDAALSRDPQGSVVVCGDFNDQRNSKPLRLILSRGRQGLIDTHPSERRCDGSPSIDDGKRRVMWTHYYAAEESYTRLDYILLGRGMASRWVPSGSYVLSSPGWGTGSDHRPVVCEFSLTE